MLTLRYDAAADYYVRFRLPPTYATITLRFIDAFHYAIFQLCAFRHAAADAYAAISPAALLPLAAIFFVLHFHAFTCRCRLMLPCRLRHCQIAAMMYLC